MRIQKEVNMPKIREKKNRRRAGMILILLGLIFLEAAGILLLFNRWDDSRAGDAADEVLEKLKEQIGDDPETTSAAGSLVDMEPVVEVDGNGYIGYLSIPSLGLELPVMSEWNYPNLRIAPCRYSGSLFNYNLVICGHNYDRHFGRLKTLNTGDQVTFTGADGKTRHYEVTFVETLEPTAIEYMTDSRYELTLFTCTYGGASRVTVRCRRADEQ